MLKKYSFYIFASVVILFFVLVFCAGYFGKNEKGKEGTNGSCCCGNGATASSSNCENNATGSNS